MKTRSLIAFLFFLSTVVVAQQPAFTSEELDLNKYIKGTLTFPSDVEKPPLVILVQGSGPVDRNGNQSFMKNDSFKKLATQLAEAGIATYRFDKRILQMRRLGIKEEDIRFDDFITDVSTALEHFKNADAYKNISVLGHSQGSLVGMIAAKDKADAFISIAGAAHPIDSIIVDQIAGQMPGLKENVQQSFKDMRETGSSRNYNPMLEMVFRPSVQPFILSWMQYDPQKEIQELDIPVLLINGSNDLQVQEEQAELLKKSKPEAELVILEKMNHVFRKIEGDDLENSKSYNDAGLPLHPELVPVITNFINSL
ncbi:alpha/beta hydrolase [Salinimicrobium catena]|uniref:alpha/beta hydrolase family protein n=1 Tax=Salinimicrobium catena TaxID=390640 RepID=UPI002FE49D88